MANKKGQVSMNEWPAVVVVMVIAFVTLAIGAQVTNNLNTVNCNTGNFTALGRCVQTANATGGQLVTPSVASNVTLSGLDTFANTASLSPMIGLVVIAGIVIGALAFFRRGA